MLFPGRRTWSSRVRSCIGHHPFSGTENTATSQIVYRSFIGPMSSPPKGCIHCKQNQFLRKWERGIASAVGFSGLPTRIISCRRNRVPPRKAGRQDSLSIHPEQTQNRPIETMRAMCCQSCEYGGFSLARGATLGAAIPHCVDAFALLVTGSSPTPCRLATSCVYEQV